MTAGGITAKDALTVVITPIVWQLFDRLAASGRISVSGLVSRSVEQDEEGRIVLRVGLADEAHRDVELFDAREAQDNALWRSYHVWLPRFEPRLEEAFPAEVAP